MAELTRDKTKNVDEGRTAGNYTHKVGVKILSEVQLKNTLPTYEKLIARIEDCRKAAQSSSIPMGHYQYNFMYDNVFSILGERGTGKTSVAFTLQKKIGENEKYKEYDVVLPLVIPEVIPEHCTVLGWLLAIVKEEIEQLEERIRKKERKSTGEQYRGKYHFCRDNQSDQSLVNKLEEISHMVFAGSYNPSNEMSYYRAIGYSVQQAEDYYKFAKGIAELWDSWIARIKEWYMLENEVSECNICPMIYFIFDDVDLAPEKISELLSVIIKYLSHPNLIVITTADERLFLEVIENQLDKKIGRLPREWREYLKGEGKSEFDDWDREERERKKEVEDVVDRTARMYLGKVLPPSTRHYLRLFHTAKQKERFYVEEREQLGEAVCREIGELVKRLDENGRNFMMPNNTLINFYLRFVGYTSRQISNVYIAIKELIGNMYRLVDEVRKEERTGEERIREEDDSREDNIKEEYAYRIYQDCRYFLCIAINSNHDLTRVMMDIEGFVDEVFLPEYNQWRIYVNYPYINEYVEETVGEKVEGDKAVKVEIALQLYSLFVFVENILLLMEKAFAGGITGRQKVHAAAFMTEYIQRMAFNNRHIFRDDQDPNVFFEHYNNLLDRLKSIVADEKRSDAKFAIAYFYDFRNYRINRKMKNQYALGSLRDFSQSNPKWFKELVGMLTMVYGNAYLFTEKDMANCLAFRDKKYQVRYQHKICNELQENIGKCFEYIKLQNIWLKGGWAECISMQYEEPDKDSVGFFELVRKVTDTIIQMRQGQKQEHLMVDLRLVLETVFQYVKMDDSLNKTDMIQQLVLQCPYAVAYELVRNLKNISSDGGTIKRMLSDRIAAIEQVEYTWNNMGILYDPLNMMEVFEHLYRIGGSKYEELRRVGMEIHAPKYTHNDLIPSEKQGSMAVLDRNSYRRLLNVVTRTMEKVQTNNYIGVDEEAAKDDAKEVLAECDICIDMYNTESVIRAVSLGLEVVQVELLQQLYIFHTIYERYEKHNSLSSWELERVNNRNTYYDTLFELIVDMVENDKQPRRQANLKEIIKLAFVLERQKYTEQLIIGAKDE